MKKVIAVALYYLLALSIIFIVGCGGGSSGTGGDGAVGVRGSIRTTDDKPVPNAKLTILGTQDVATTDSEGKFEIKSTSLDNSLAIQLIVQIESLTSTINLGAIPGDKNTVAVHLIFNQILGTVGVGELSFLNDLAGLNDIVSSTQDATNNIDQAVHDINSATNDIQGAASDINDSATQINNAAGDIQKEVGAIQPPDKILKE